MAWQNNSQQKAPLNYDFVPFPETVNCSYLKDISKRSGEYSGVISLKIKAVDHLYIGTGNVDFDSRTGLSAKTMIEDGHAVIPGSSVKGAIRHVARAISDGCIEASEGIRLSLASKQRGKCYMPPKLEPDLKICIVCDMFGMMGLGSKISVSDFTAENCTTVQRKVPTQYSPQPDKPCYKEDERHIGYKFYYTECDSREMLPHYDTIYAVKAGTVFTGEIRFIGLDETELYLLLFSIGLGGIQYQDGDGNLQTVKFSHKLGGYRADGYGTVNFICTELILNGDVQTERVQELSEEYGKICSDDAYNRILDYLTDIMKYKE